MKCKFLQRDLEQRLNSTYCRYKGVPVFVRYLERNSLVLYELSTGGSHQVAVIKADDDDFDVSTPPLGYVQVTPERCVYISRIPHRRYKQGIDRDSMNIQYLPDVKEMTRFEPLSQAFKNTLSGFSVPVQEALGIIAKTTRYTDIALNNDCCVVYKPELQSVYVFYKNDVVGWIPPTELSKHRPKVLVPSSDKAWIVSVFLQQFKWEVE